MLCKACYRENTKDYCLDCRKRLFEKAKISAILPFEAPKADNVHFFQEHSRQMSISGVQLKYSLRLEKNELLLTEKNAQYMLKPVPPSNFLVAREDVPENEHLTMQIARQVFGINTAENALIYFKDGTPAYLTKRFDVAGDGHKYQQEDFAQLSNRTKDSHGHSFKYEGSYEDIGLLIKKYVAASMPALEKYFHVIVFNYVIANGDAHLKNFSINRNNNGEYQLTPFYDLMSTVLHTPNESDTALDLYDKDMESEFYAKYGFYGKTNFLTLAEKLGLHPKRVERILLGFQEKKEEIKRMVVQSFLSDQSKQVYVKNLEDRLSRLSNY